PHRPRALHVVGPTNDGRRPMKVLRNPFVVGVLGLLAAGMVLKSLWPALRGRVRSRSAAGVATSAPTAAPPGATPRLVPPAAALAASAPSPDAPVSLENPAQTGADPGALLPSEINLELVRQDAPHWSEGRRDPFQIRSTPAKPVYPRAMELLTLGAIWRQT